VHSKKEVIKLIFGRGDKVNFGSVGNLGELTLENSFSEVWIFQVDLRSEKRWP